jgi:hypothetical protein
MRDEFEIELQRPEAGEFDDQLSDEALDRVAAPALASGCTATQPGQSGQSITLLREEIHERQDRAAACRIADELSDALGRPQPG